MFISDFAIKRPLVTIVSMLALVAFGLVAFSIFKILLGRHMGGTGVREQAEALS